MRVGLLGYGRAGRAVAQVLQDDPNFDLVWVARKSLDAPAQTVAGTSVPVVCVAAADWERWLDANPVEALIDFSQPPALSCYGEALRRRHIMLVSAVSNYSQQELDYARSLGLDARVMCSPNITLGINFLIMAAKLLRRIAPLADVAIIEQHFRDKPDVSGTARKIAETLQLSQQHISSLRLGGIVGYHEVIFGFPYQTIHLVHNSIERRAFGTGAVFALTQLAQSPGYGFYSFDELMLRLMRPSADDDEPGPGADLSAHM